MTARLTLPECRAADNAAYGPEEQQEYEAVRDAFRRLRDRGQLRHGAGTFRFGDWSVRL